MAKRLIWKTVALKSLDEAQRLQAAWGSSSQAFGAGRTLKIERTTVETDLPVRFLRELCRSADVRVDWRNGVVWDTVPSWEQAD